MTEAINSSTLRKMELCAKPFSKSLSVFLILSTLFSPVNSHGLADASPNAPPRELAHHRPYQVAHDPGRPRSIFLPQLVSFILPGFDQWWEGQTGAAIAYTGMFLGGVGYSLLMENDVDKRHMNLGLQLAGAAGGYSAYHSFRSAVTTRKPYGEFAFLEAEESSAEIFISPFRFDYLTRPTTLIPLGAAITLVILAAGGNLDPGNLSLSDGYFALTKSYLAGSWEECVFRGWLMPVGMHYLRNAWIANFVTSLGFAAAHYNGTYIPWVQFVLGAYMGFVTVQNRWAISESIFMHSWWDVIVISATYSIQHKEIMIRLPALQMVF